MHEFYFVCLLVAVVLFACAALGATTRRVNLLAAGLFFLALVQLVQEFQKMR